MPSRARKRRAYKGVVYRQLVNKTPCVVEDDPVAKWVYVEDAAELENGHFRAEIIPAKASHALLYLEYNYLL